MKLGRNQTFNHVHHTSLTAVVKNTSLYLQLSNHKITFVKVVFYIVFPIIIKVR